MHDTKLKCIDCQLDQNPHEQLTPGSLTDELLGAQPLCTKFSTAEKVVLALELFYKFVKCWISGYL